MSLSINLMHPYWIKVFSFKKSLLTTKLLNSSVILKYSNEVKLLWCFTPLNTKIETDLYECGCWTYFLSASAITGSVGNESKNAVQSTDFQNIMCGIKVCKVITQTTRMLTIQPHSFISDMCELLFCLTCSSSLLSEGCKSFYKNNLSNPVKDACGAITWQT